MHIDRTTLSQRHEILLRHEKNITNRKHTFTNGDRLQTTATLHGQKLYNIRQTDGIGESGTGESDTQLALPPILSAYAFKIW